MKHIKGLRVDFESGEGEVELSEEFTQQSALLRADVLGDWQAMITELYNEAVVDLGEWMESLPRKSP